MMKVTAVVMRASPYMSALVNYQDMVAVYRLTIISAPFLQPPESRKNNHSNHHDKYCAYKKGSQGKDKGYIHAVTSPLTRL